MSVAEQQTQTSCGRVGMRQGTSEVCSMCSGCDEDRRDILIASWRVRIERCCSPLTGEVSTTRIRHTFATILHRYAQIRDAFAKLLDSSFADLR
eukprot:2365580-Prymnesium_polylepis.1